MEKKQMMNILIPAVAAAAVVVLIALIIGMDPGETKTTAKGGNEPASAKSVAKAEYNDSGMSDSLPSPEAPQWSATVGGMKVWDIKEGEGDPCKSGANVTIHYAGWTMGGTLFDSSRKALEGQLTKPVSGDPASFGLGGLIKGWQEGIPGMKPGGIRRLMIPPDWAYGASGRPPTIPPNATLVFEVKLLAWK